MRDRFFFFFLSTHVPLCACACIVVRIERATLSNLSRPDRPFVERWNKNEQEKKKKKLEKNNHNAFSAKAVKSVRACVRMRIVRGFATGFGKVLQHAIVRTYKRRTISHGNSRQNGRPAGRVYGETSLTGITEERWE